MSDVSERLSELFTSTMLKVKWIMEERMSWPASLVTGAATVILVSLFVNKRLKMRETREKIEKTREKRERQMNEVHRLLTEDGAHDLITDHRQQILELNFDELIEALKSHRLKPSEVLDAFMARALEVTRATNCVCFFVPEARDWAARLDLLEPEERGPLHGLPVSIKECFRIKGLDYTAGLSRFVGLPASSDAPFVSALKRLGCVPFCTTNVPQTMKSFVCSNPIYGVTSHPLDPLRSPGGSSGGEACLIATGGSVLGLGSDLSGSVRMPAHVSGICGFKPTSSRIYNGDRRHGAAGHGVGACSSSGLMASEMSAIITSMRLLCRDPWSMSEHDGEVVPLPWNDQLFDPGRKLRVGFYTMENWLQLTPGSKRALEESLEMMRQQGHHVVNFEPPRWEELANITCQHVLADGGTNALMFLKDDLVDDDAIGLNMLVWRMPYWVKMWLLKPLFHLFISKFLAKTSFEFPKLSSDLWITVGKLKEIKTEFLRKWNEEQIDVLLTPAWSTSATLPKGSSALTLHGTTITGIYNALDFPAGVVPVTRISKEDEDRLMSEYPNSDLLHSVIRRSGPGSVGLPMGVQVVGKPFNEEMVLHAMKIVEEARDRRGEFQRTERKAFRGDR